MTVDRQPLPGGAGVGMVIVQLTDAMASAQWIDAMASVATYIGGERA